MFKVTVWAIEMTFHLGVSRFVKLREKFLVTNKCEIIDAEMRFYLLSGKQLFKPLQCTTKLDCVISLHKYFSSKINRKSTCTS